MPEPLAPDCNVAPTKEVYAVVERPPRRAEGETPAEEPQRQLRVLTWGLVPSWAKDPADRQPDDQRPDGDGRREAGVPPGLRRAALPAAGRRLLRVVPDLAARPQAGKPRKQPFFIRPKDGGILAMAGLYEIWRDPTRTDDDPDRFRWTCTVLTTDAEDDLGHIHDRMPLMVERDRWARLARPAHLRARRPARAAGAGGAGPARGVPGLDAGEQRPQQRPRAGRADPARGGAVVTAAPSRGRRHAVRRGAAGRRPGPPPDRHAAALPRRGQRHRHPRPRGAGRRTCRATASPSRGSSSRGARPAARSRRRRPRSTSASPRPRTRCAPAPRSSSAAAPPGPGRRPAAPAPRRQRVPGPVLPAAPARQARALAARRAARRRRADAGRAGRARPDGPARGVPRGPALDLTVVPGADHGFAVAKLGRAHRGRGDGGGRRGDARVGGPRGRRRRRRESAAHLTCWDGHARRPRSTRHPRIAGGR